MAKKSRVYEKIILAFSGGLDTSFCVPFLKEEFNAEVVTVTVDTSGLSAGTMKAIEERSKELGASKHVSVPGIQKVYDEYVGYIIKGNVLKGNKYPLCVGAERAVQAMAVIDVARKENAQAVAHGSTGAGNDQIRFDTVIRTIAPSLDIITPIRDNDFSRNYEINYLKQHGVSVSTASKTYSINESIWGVTIGGGKIHDAWQEPPEEAYFWTKPLHETPDSPTYVTLAFDKGLPVAINDERLSGPEILSKLNSIGAENGYGRGIHLGDTIIGIKGRIVFEAPGTLSLIEAHRELEKLVLTKQQMFWKEQLAHQWGYLLHHGLYMEPLMADIQSFIDSSQTYVSGSVRLKFFKGTCTTVGVKSPYAMTRKNLVYGESSAQWHGDEARSFGKIYSLQSQLAYQAHKQPKSNNGEI
ncbi:MAG: argininosuccinate synthase [Candidatus Ranarchaeia archaeon]